MSNPITVSRAAGRVPAPRKAGMVQNGAELCTFSNSGDAPSASTGHNSRQPQELPQLPVPVAPVPVVQMHHPAPPAPVPLEPQQAKALELLLMGTPDVKIAEEIGVHRNTIRRWRGLPAIASVLEEHSAVVVRSATSELKTLLPDVARVLRWQLVVQDNDLNYRAASLLLKTLLRGPAGRQSADPKISET